MPLGVYHPLGLRVIKRAGDTNRSCKASGVRDQNDYIHVSICTLKWILMRYMCCGFVLWGISMPLQEFTLSNFVGLLFMCSVGWFEPLAEPNHVN